jgi:hypothetical protein
LGFITSNGFLRLDSFEKLREYLLKTGSLQRLIDFTGNVFEQAVVKTVLMIFAKGQREEQSVQVASTAPKTELSELPFQPIPQSAFRKTYKHIFDLSINPRFERIKKKMLTGSVPLGNLFELSFGLKTGDDSKFLMRVKKTTSHKPLLRGENVHKYGYDFEGEYVWYVPELMRQHRTTARPGTSARFEQPKVLVRDTGLLLEATFEDKNFYVKDVLVITMASKDARLLRTLTGLLNSTVLRFYYETSFPTLHVQRDELASLPIPHIDDAESNVISSLVQRRLKARDNDIEELEEQINKHAAALYGLDESDLLVIREHT